MTPRIQRSQDVEVDVVCVPMAHLVDGDDPVDEWDVCRLTDEALLQQLAEACEVPPPLGGCASSQP